MIRKNGPTGVILGDVAWRKGYGLDTGDSPNVRHRDAGLTLNEPKNPNHNGIVSVVLSGKVTGWKCAAADTPKTSLQVLCDVPCRNAALVHSSSRLPQLLSTLVRDYRSSCPLLFATTVRKMLTVCPTLTPLPVAKVGGEVVDRQRYISPSRGLPKGAPDPTDPCPDASVGSEPDVG